MTHRGAADRPLFVERVLLFSDIEASTERWEDDPQCMRVLLDHHNRSVTEAVGGHGGTLVQRTGDGAIAAFEAAADAVEAAVEMRFRLEAGPSDTGQAADPLRVRIGLHRGVVEPRDGDLFGPAMHRCARIMAAGHGGQILASALVATELAESPALPLQLIDRGTHRLKGFRQHEHISEVVPEGAAPGPATLRTENAVEGWLPAIDGDAFVGREHELAEVSALLEPGRIVTLVGTGGVGKTRLAVRVADRTRGNFPDGVWFIDLAAVADPSRVVPAMADALDVAASPSHSLLDAVGGALCDRSVLLVLDNCEHVFEGVCDALVGVLQKAATATVLCTSQRDVGVRGEHVVRIGPLDVADDVVGSPAGQLFVARARAADADFVVDDESVGHIRAICERLDGLPLAIELAAARARVMPVTEIAHRLSETFDLLRSRHGVERHRTLDAAINWSLDLLDDSDRRILGAVSVFSSRFEWRAAAAVAGGDELEVLDCLDELVRRSLVVRAGSQFRLLAPVRAHCRSLLDRSEEMVAVQARHARWMASSVPSPVDDPDVTVVAGRLDAIADASEDLYTAFSFLAERSPEDAARLALDLSEFWTSRGRGQEALELLAAIEPEALPLTLAIDLLGEIAALGWTSGRVEDGELAGRRALAMAEEAGQPVPTGAGTWLAVRLSFSSRPTEARELAEEVERELRRGNGEIGLYFGPLSIVFAVTGDHPRAVQQADEAIAAARDVGVIALMSAIGNRLLLAPEDPSSEPLRAEAVHLARTLGRTDIVAHAVLAAANCCLHDGDVAGFLIGAAEFCDLLIDTQPTSVLSALQLTTEPATAVNPRAAAVMLGAVEHLAEDLHHQGSPLDGRRAGKVIDKTTGAIGADEVARARAEGQTLSLDEAVDLLHWLCELVD